jgi:hypothetical protein
MSTPPELHHEEFERTDTLPRLDLNVLADATPINSDLLTRTDSWSFEVLQDLRWPQQADFAPFGGDAPVPQVDISNLRVVDHDFTDMITPHELGLGGPEITSSALLAALAAAPPASDAAEDLQAACIAATLDQEIVLFAEEHAASTPVGSREPQAEKALALDRLSDLSILLDTDTSSVTHAAAASSATGNTTVEESITWVDIPQEYTPANLAEGAEHLQLLLEHGQEDVAARARHLALQLMDGQSVAKPLAAAPAQLESHSRVQALFPESQHEQQPELLAAQQSIEAMRASNELLQQAVTASQQRVEFLKSEVERHTEIAEARDSQLATSIDELTSRRLAMRELERVIQARDEIIAGLRAELEALRVELQTAKDERGIMAINLAKTRERAKVLREQLLEKNNLLQSLHADPAEHTQTFARACAEGLAADLPERLLIPIDHGGQNIHLDRPMLIVGRTPQQADISIPSTLISRQHARLIITSEAVVIEDLNSTNGCFVNDRRVQKKMLREGDILTLADVKYRLSQRHPRGMLND